MTSASREMLHTGHEPITTHVTSEKKVLLTNYKQSTSTHVTNEMTSYWAVHRMSPSKIAQYQTINSLIGLHFLNHNPPPMIDMIFFLAWQTRICDVILDEHIHIFNCNYLPDDT